MPGLVPYPTISQSTSGGPGRKHLTDDYFNWQNKTRDTKVTWVLLVVLESGANRFRVLKLGTYFQLQYMVIRNFLSFYVF